MQDHAVPGGSKTGVMLSGDLLLLHRLQTTLVLQQRSPIVAVLRHLLISGTN